MTHHHPFANIVSLPDQGEWTMQVDERVLEDVLANAGIELPVSITFDADMKPGCCGALLIDPESDEHEIRLTSRAFGCCDTHRHLTARTLSESLLHEIRHAWQREKYGADLSVKLYRVLDAEYGYRNNPMEKDARAWAARHVDRFPGLVYGEPITVGLIDQELAVA